MMKMVLGVLAFGAVCAVALCAFVGYRLAVYPPTYPDVPYPDLHASTDPDIIAQGKYLVDAVAHCTICHTKKEDFIGRESVAGAIPSGGHEWVMGPMGTLRSVNITSDVATGIGGMSDAELARVIKYAVRPNHQPALMMVAVGPMADEDIVAVMSYLRSLPAVSNVTPRTEFTTLGTIVLPLTAGAYVAPKPDWDLPPRVPEGRIDVARGRYLANGPAFCFVCHSNPQIHPVIGILGPRFAGCITADPDPDDSSMELCAPNLTPDPEFGHITQWSEDQFVARLRAGRVLHSSSMPWENYRLMTDADLRSIYRYLRTVPPVPRNTGPTHRKAGWSP